MLKMMIKSLISAGIILMSSTNFAIEVFTTVDQPVYNLDSITPCVLGTKSTGHINHILQQQCANDNCLSADEAKTEYLAQLKDIDSGMMCSFKAYKLGIKRLPAIVFDHQYVVYGVNNLDIAKQRYADYEANKDE